MLLIVNVIGGATGNRVDDLSLWGDVIGSIALATIGSSTLRSKIKLRVVSV
jgi:hypothetical protein